MKGKATFTLTNAATGRVERKFTEHNLVTNAVSRLLSPPGYTIMGKFSWSDFIGTSLPLYKELFGGIMLLSTTLTESADTVMLPPDCIPLATAGDAYAGSLATRGSLNLNETGEIGDGYHFVWDFGTDKANGTINCVALTSRLFGNTGFSSDEKTGGLIMNPVTKTAIDPTDKFCHAYGLYLATTEKFTHLYVQKNSSSELIFTRVKSVDPQNICINDSVNINTLQEAYDTRSVMLPIECDNITRPYLDAAENKAYFFAKQYNTETESYIDYVSVDLDTFAVSAKKRWPTSQKFNYITAAAIHGGRLYAAWSDILTAFSASGEIAGNWTTKCSGDLWFSNLNGVLTMHAYNGYSYSLYSGNWYSAFNDATSPFAFGASVDIKPPYYPVHGISQYYNVAHKSTIDPYLGAAANYVATVNNLSTPLVKTNEHTLKIAYDITN